VSRIGKKVILLKTGVKARMDSASQTLTIEGPKGKLSMVVSPCIVVNLTPEQLSFTMKEGDTSSTTNEIYGLTRALASNMVTGVSQGFSKALEIVGVGFKAELKGKDLVLNVGYSHPVVYAPPAGISFTLETPTKIIVLGSDRRMVGQVASEIRGVREPEPYKGKGIKYDNEHIRRKAGKAAV
jgi:large subunit ribosomal protein L6